MKLKTLEDYPNLSERINLKKEMVEVLENAREWTNRIMRAGSGAKGINKDRLLDYTIKLQEWVERLNDDVLEQTEARREVDEWLDTLKPDHRKVIRTKFCDCKDGNKLTWMQVAQRTGYSERAVYYIWDKIKRELA